jgi:hypothetical protein
VHFYILFQINIYSDRSLADAIWWKFDKRTNWASREQERNEMLYQFISFIYT